MIIRVLNTDLMTEQRNSSTLLISNREADFEVLVYPWDLGRYV